MREARIGRNGRNYSRCIGAEFMIDHSASSSVGLNVSEEVPPLAPAELLPALYDELRRIAAQYLRGERRDHTLQPTELVHEAYSRLADNTRMVWNDRTHFLSVAAVTMRRVLVDHARKRRTAKRGHGRHRAAISLLVDEQSERPVDLPALDDALRALERLDQRQARIVELRYFGGLSVEQTAQVLAVSSRTVESDWRMSRAWLRHALGP